VEFPGGITGTGRGEKSSKLEAGRKRMKGHSIRIRSKK
jgi:hypothetical protein